VVAESGAIVNYILRRYVDGRLQPAPSTANYNQYVHWMSMRKTGTIADSFDSRTLLGEDDRNNSAHSRLRFVFT
jgi:hypothetical protein